MTLLLGTESVAWSQPPTPQLLSWSVAVEDGVPSSPPRARTYRLFQSPTEVRLVFSFGNQSNSELVFPVEAFRSSVAVHVAAEPKTPLNVTWDNEIRRSRDDLPTVLVPQDRIPVEPGRGFTWAATVRRTDGSPLPFGTHEIAVDLQPALATIEGGGSVAWRQNSALKFELTLDIAPPNTPRDRAAQSAAAAKAAANRNRHSEAVSAYLSAIEASPNDPELHAGLGHSYLALGNYRQAIAAYEAAMPLLQGQRSGLYQLVAFAYVALREESNASRVLREDGHSDARIADDIRRFQDEARRRPPPR